MIVRRLVLAVVGGAMLVAVSGCGRSAIAGASARTRSPGSTYTLMQMNVCLSGLAECYDPAVVPEAVTRIREEHPDAVTFNEACQGDMGRIARATGYHLRFSTVIYSGRPLRCVKPAGRGRFGDAVLTRTRVARTDSEEFKTEEGIERRRWLCVSTVVRVDVCTAHLNTRSAAEVAGNDAQCLELAAVLARRAAAGTVIFGGDVNRRRSCAPDGFWTRTDSSAHQDPGLQQAYGSRPLGSPASDVVPAMHTDHDVLLVRARLPRGRLVFTKEKVQRP